MENFATQGGMLPEQVWDAPDLPAAFMYLGRPAGSATPLMWAHAEYIKLLRSVSERRVFDQIPVVAERFLQQRGRRDLEVWKFTRRVRNVRAGDVLRVLAPGPFHLRWSTTGDGNFQDTASTDSGLGLGFVDIKTGPAQTAPVRFMFLDSTSFPQDTIHEVAISKGA